MTWKPEGKIKRFVLHQDFWVGKVLHSFTDFFDTEEEKQELIKMRTEQVEAK